MMWMVPNVPPFERMNLDKTFGFDVKALAADQTFTV